MKNHVTICGKKWQLKSKKNLKDEEGNELHGQCNYADRIIYIDNATKMEDVFCETVVHEIIHAILHECCIELDPVVDEAIAGNVAKSLVSIFKVRLK